MFVLLLLGFALRDGLVWLAVWASNFHAVAGMLAFALVPLSLLSAMVLILRVVRPSLPGAVSTSPSQSPKAGAVGQVASVLVPFLAVYAAYDMLLADRQLYTYRIITEEIFSSFGEGIDKRMPFDFNPTLITVVLTAVALRFLLGMKFAQKIPLIGFARAYLEVIWLTLVAVAISGVRNPSVDWAENRRLTAWALNTLNAAIDALGPLASVGHQVKDWAGKLFGSVDTVIIVPIAWLAIGAVIYGQRIAAADRRDEITGKIQRRWNLLPAAVRRLGAPLRSDIVDSFSPLARGLRTIRHAGVRAMLLFCLAFTAANTLPQWLNELERLIIGPQDIDLVWAPASVVLSTINQSIGMVVMVCLVAAAVDFVLSAQPEPQAAPAPAEPTSPDAGGQANVVGVPGNPGHADSFWLSQSGQEEIGRHPVGR